MPPPRVVLLCDGASEMPRGCPALCDVKLAVGGAFYQNLFWGGGDFYLPVGPLLSFYVFVFFFFKKSRLCFSIEKVKD